ncbi:glycosyl transferase family 1 [Larkinella arboricola]|uniref:Glycosyl transferase family 1 n=1 Tax=Larkinella arboricola TaxID=643671 RepID=A0A327WYZ3_LARAB|nr:glycosyltransferase family 4 protein [Larkinella arboricola]RAJ97770.1 glycosyl transferase family 1 [Larkinella arboricola]
MKKILFFTPYGSFTGSEVVLWTYLQNFDRGQLRAALYSEQQGPLTQQLPADIPLFTSPFDRGRLQRIYSKVTNAMGVEVYKNNIRRIQEQYQADYWYLNTVLMFPLSSLAEQMGVRTISHIHELHSSFESIGYQEMAHAMTYSDLVIGVTGQICELATVMGAKKTALLYPVVDLSRKTISSQRVEELRKQLKIAPGAFVWTMVGTRIYRKGVDLFPFIAQALADQSCHFIWMGNSKPTGLNYLVDSQVKALNLPNVSFVDVQTDDYYNYLQLADGLVMTSREEPFGKIMTEAASLGKPLVAPNAGGAREFISQGMGELIDYPTPEEFRKAMLNVMQNPAAYHKELLIEKSHQFDAGIQTKHWQEAILAL